MAGGRAAVSIGCILRRRAVALLDLVPALGFVFDLGQLAGFYKKTETSVFR
jgi:hypothetical protein